MRKEKKYRKDIGSQTTAIPDEQLKRMMATTFHKSINKAIFDEMKNVPKKSKSYHLRPQDIPTKSLMAKKISTNPFDQMTAMGQHENRHIKTFQLTYDDMKNNYVHIDQDIENNQNQTFYNAIVADKNSAQIFDEGQGLQLTTETEESQRKKTKVQFLQDDQGSETSFL